MGNAAHLVVAGLHFHLHGGHTSLALNEIADGPEEVPVGLMFDDS